MADRPSITDEQMAYLLQASREFALRQLSKLSAPVVQAMAQHANRVLPGLGSLLDIEWVSFSLAVVLTILFSLYHVSRDIVQYVQKQQEMERAGAPICAPTQCPWGNKAFSGYLGADKASWRAYDATELVQTLNQVYRDAGVWLPPTVMVGEVDKQAIGRAMVIAPPSAAGSASCPRAVLAACARGTSPAGRSSHPRMRCPPRGSSSGSPRRCRSAPRRGHARRQREAAVAALHDERDEREDQRSTG